MLATAEPSTFPVSPEILLGGLVFLVIVSIGGAIFAVVGQRRRALDARLKQLHDHTSAALVGPEEEDEPDPEADSVVERVGKGMSKGGASAKLKAELARAGFYGRGAPAAFLGYKMLLLALGLLAAVLLMLFSGLSVMGNVLCGMIVAGALFFIPNFIVGFRKGKRTKQIRETLPDAVDLLEVGVTAGMGLDMAWNAVTDEIRRVSPILADEMALTNLEMQLGASRSESMRHMADRTGAAELSSLVALLVQSDRFGTSVGDTLRMFAASIRESRSQKAEESAEKMAVKLLIPMVLCIFPVMLIVMVGPAGMTIFRMMGEN